MWKELSMIKKCDCLKIDIQWHFRGCRVSERETYIKLTDAISPTGDPCLSSVVDGIQILPPDIGLTWLICFHINRISVIIYPSKYQVSSMKILTIGCHFSSETLKFDAFATFLHM